MKVVDFLVCDDLRTEVGNKVSLMGIFDDIIEIPILGEIAQSPSASGKRIMGLRLALFARVRFGDEDALPDHCRIIVKLDETELARIDGALQIPNATRILRIPINIPALPLPGPGQLSFNMTMLKGEAELDSYTHSVTVEVGSDLQAS